MRARFHVALAGGGICLCAGLSSAQSTAPAAFVANNGNLEGSVSSFTFSPSGQPVFVQRLIIGTRPNTQTPEPGTNAYSIALSPNGRWLITSHATESTTVEQLTILEVGADASLTLRAERTTPDSPLDLAWTDNGHVVVTRTRTSGGNELVVYAFDPATYTLTEIDRESTGNFTSSVAVHPGGQMVFTGDTSSFWIRVFAVDETGRLSLVQTVGTGGIYTIGVAVTPDGSKLYAAGGISGGGHAILGYHVSSEGLSAMAGSPFVSPGQSPSNISISSDSAVLFLGHGTDATVRSFSIEPASGELAATGAIFDVGLQGSLGDAAVLGNLLLVTDDTSALDGVTGLYSFTIGAGGTFTQNGAIAPTGATAPTEIAAWSPPALCPGDVSGDRDVDLEDLAGLVAVFGLCAGSPGYLPAADFDSSGCVDLPDLGVLLANFGGSCP